MRRFQNICLSGIELAAILMTSAPNLAYSDWVDAVSKRSSFKDRILFNWLVSCLKARWQNGSMP